MGRRAFRIGALGLYAFVLFFQPPLTPVSQVYITGAVTLLLLAMEHGTGDIETIVGRSRMDYVLVALVVMSAYLLMVSLVDLLFIEESNVTVNRFRCFNQLFVLTIIQMAGILYILVKANAWKLSLDDVLLVALIAGALQALCCLAAYFSPQVRALFLTFADDIYRNPWQYERRGFGFSSTLLDTFGYGIGMLCGILLARPLRSKLANLVAFALLVFVALQNSRTGLVVIALVFAIWLVARRDGVSGVLLVAAVALLAFYAFRLIPEIVGCMNRSDSVTIRWVGSALNDFYLMVTGQIELSDVQFVDDIAPLSSVPFEVIFGSGHSIYDTSQELGFRSDIGYLNVVWIYGVIGTLLYYGFVVYLGVVAFNSQSERRYRVLAISVLAAFFLVQFKGNVLGASPGICVTYFCLFSLIAFGDGKERHSTCSPGQSELLCGSCVGLVGGNKDEG